MKNKIETLDIKKSCADGHKTVKLTKMNEEIFSKFIFQNFNQLLVDSKFLLCLKQAEVTFAMKKAAKRVKSKPRAFYL